MMDKFLNRYRYALCDGRIVKIDDVTKESRKTSTFICIGCGHEMVAVLGDYREHHYRHKNNENCSNETYLHNLKKREIKEIFDHEEHFYIYYKAINSCDLFGTCKLHRCKKAFLQTIDLKEYFDTCELEKTCGNFRPDILLSHSEIPNRRLFIEIHVNNPCSPEKVASGIRIIEIDIFNELTKIYPFHEQLPNIHFYNFSFNRGIVPSDKLDRFSLLVHDDGTKEFKTDSIECFKIDAHIEDAEFDMIIKKPNERINISLLGLAQTMIKGTNVMHCRFCRKYNYCVVTITQKSIDAKSGKEKQVNSYYKVINLSDDNHWALASQCKNYIPDQRGCHDLIKKFGNHNFILWEGNKTKK